MRDGEISGRSDPARGGQTTAATSAATSARSIPARRSSRPRTRQLCSAARLEGSLRQMPDRLTAQGIFRLNAKRVERPEIRFCNAKQGPPSSNHPAATMTSSRSARAHAIQLYDWENTPPTHAVTMSGARPRIARPVHHRRNPRERSLSGRSGYQALPRSPATTSASGSRRRLSIAIARIEDRPRPPVGALSESSNAPLEGENVGRSHGVGGAILPQPLRHSMRRLRLGKRATKGNPSIHRRSKRCVDNRVDSGGPANVPRALLYLSPWRD